MGGSANFPDRPFRLRDEYSIQQQDQANNRTLLAFSVWIDKTGYSPTFSNDGIAYSRWGYDGVVRAENNGRGFDFTGGGPWQTINSSIWIPHNADGTKRISVEVGAQYALLGTTQYAYWLDLPTIPRTAPPAPTPLGLDQITRNSMRYRFQSNGDGGSPIIRWEFQYSADPAFTGAPLVVSSGTSTVTGLNPGTLYYFRSRGVNAAGNGAWSAVISARTLSGAWISDGTAWKPADVLISDGTSWKNAEVLISDGTTWKPAG